MVEREKIEISAELLEELRRGAREQGRPEADLLKEAVRLYLQGPTGRPGSLGELFERIDRGQRGWGVEPLSEEEVERIAYEELHAMRRERKAADRRSS